MALNFGQGSGDFNETRGRIQPFHKGVSNTVGILTADSFTQANPPVVATNVSTTLSGITGIKAGVLGSSVAFTRPDAGSGYIGGPTANVKAVPLGFFINDALGNAYENTPGAASGRGPYYSGMGCYGLSLYETQNLSGGALTWSVGDKVYASRNGLATNVNNQANSHECNLAAADNVATVLGIVKVVPSATNNLLVIDLRV